jgi:very-short-patch-repair endonuclease
MPELDKLPIADILKNSVESIRKGDIDTGRQGLMYVLQKDKTSIHAWLWLAYITEDIDKKLDCYEYILKLNPANETANRAIAKYSALKSSRVKAPSPEKISWMGTTIPEKGLESHTTLTIDEVEIKLNDARKDLLDLSLYNKLLNYHPLRSKGLEIIDERPVEVYRILVQEGRTMSFLPIDKENNFVEGEKTEQSAKSPELALTQPDNEGNGHTDRYTDNKLQTPYASDVLQNRLLSTFYTARTYIEEQGVNILFLALGMIRWYESDSSNEARKAPLILIPAELSRSDARSKFTVRFTEEDIEENLSLAAKLLTEFNIKLPKFPDDDQFDVDSYLKQVRSAIQTMPRWEVDQEAIALGFFSFGKFLMYHDLDLKSWPSEIKPNSHPVLKGLLVNGFHQEGDILPDDTDVDEYLPPENVNQVLDADSSQIIAILEANRGRNLVIKGPPGTGKSQTITNLIAEATAKHKKVLFVSEKMAALEVVKRRLNNVGLGDACLELHSNKTNKRTLLDELKRVMDLGCPKLDNPIDLGNLRKNRDKLNIYCKEVNEEIGDTHLTPYEVYGRLLLLRDSLLRIKPPQLAIQGIEAWPFERIQKGFSSIEELQAFIGKIGRPIDHPFWGCGVSTLLPSDQERVHNSVKAAIAAEKELVEESSKTAKVIHLPTPETQDDAQKILGILNYLIGSPNLKGVNVLSEVWTTDEPDLTKVIEAGSRVKEIRNRYQPILQSEAWSGDAASLRVELTEYSNKWWRFISPKYRGIQKQIRVYCRKPFPVDFKEELAILDAILEVKNLTNVVEGFKATGTSLFGDGWKGELTDWKWVFEVFEWQRGLNIKIQNGELPKEVLSIITSTPNYSSSLKDDCTRLENDLKKSKTCLGEVIAVLHLRESDRFGEGKSLANLSFSQKTSILRLWSEEIGRLHDISKLSELLSELETQGLQALIPIAIEWSEAATHLVNLLEYSWLTALIQRAFQERLTLSQFNGDMHEYYLQQFSQLDRAMLQQNRVLLANQHWRTIPRHEARGQLAVLNHEFAKKKRHKPIRTLLKETGNVIQILKPVFMMSPLSVAMYLSPGSVTFDMIIFDEASQIKPVDAFGSIIRGNQLIVVGDDHQLPPTTFFETGVDVDDDYYESVTMDIESILGLCCGQGMPQQMLRWHYRSKHESLITVSNCEFYENQLTVFPSPDKDRRSVGLVFHHLPDTKYDRGGNHKNIGEARAVAEAVMNHAHNAPDLTLGVAAFSVSQMEAVRDQLEILRRTNPSCEPFFMSHPEEPFFIKNLENVQGDERDVIYISIGYGRTEEGKLSMNFGPLNTEGGERRLNVLITRAKNRCEVFSNINADDIDLSRTNARGVHVLKRYLKYAETGLIDMPSLSKREMGSAFEEAVAIKLKSLGYQVDHQIGTVGFFIDLAVVDHNTPGKYLLGIECDGATYHSAHSARDRDRLRQEILESLGWRIHRIWSTDWFRNPEREIGKVQAAIASAQASLKTPILQKNDSKSEQIPIQIRRDDTPVLSPKKTIKAEPYSIAHLEIPAYRNNLHEVSADVMAEWIFKVVSIESPVHESEVLRRITDGAGVKRTGNRVEAAFQRGLETAIRRGQIIRKGTILWKPDTVHISIRTRALLPPSSRKLDLIPPEEIRLASILITESACGITKQELAGAVCELFGFARTTEGMVQVVDVVISELITRGSLVQQGEFLSVGKNPEYYKYLSAIH